MLNIATDASSCKMPAGMHCTARGLTVVKKPHSTYNTASAVAICEDQASTHQVGAGVPVGLVGWFIIVSDQDQDDVLVTMRLNDLTD